MRRFLQAPVFIAAVPTLLFAIILFGHTWVPVLDTLFSALWAHHFFSHFANGHLGLWAELSEFGQQTQLFLLACVQPTLLLLAPLAKLIPNANVLHFFYASFWIDELILLIGTFALAKRLFNHTSTVLFVCFALVGTTVWFWQGSFNFHIYYCAPLCLYFLIEGMERRTLWPVFLSGAIFAVNFPYGTYCNVALALFCLSFFLALAWQSQFFSRKLLRNFSWAEAGCGLLFLCLVAIPALWIVHSGKLAPLTSGRAGASELTYESFLSYGNHSDVPAFRDLLFGLSDAGDFGGTVFVGSMTVALCFLGLTCNRSRKQVPFIVATVTMFLFYLGEESFVAPLTFFLKGLNLYRHLQLSVALVKFGLVFLGGFGFDSLVDAVLSREGTAKNSSRLFLILSALLIVLFLVIEWPLKLNPRELLVLAILIFNLALAVNFRHGPVALSRKLISVFLFLVALDANSYRINLLHKRMFIASNEVWRSFQLRLPKFELSRYENPFNSRIFTAWLPALFDSEPTWTQTQSCFTEAQKCPGVKKFWATPYATLFQFFEVDACANPFRSVIATPEVYRLYQSYPLGGGAVFAGEDVERVKKALYGKGSGDVRKIIGCGRDKFQVFKYVARVPDAVAHVRDGHFQGGSFFTDEATFATYVESLERISSERPGNSFSVSASAASQPSLPAQFEVLESWSSHLKLKVTTSGGAGPLWLYVAGAFHPGWRATVNGFGVPILNASLAFQAVQIPAGSSLVQLDFGSTLDAVILGALWVASLFFGCLVFAMGRRLV
jgi:hypothetical protein